MAIYPTLFVGYLGHLAPSVTAGGRGIWIGVALIVAAALLNLLGAKSVGESSVAFSIVLLSPFAVLTVYALFHRAPACAPDSAAQCRFTGRNPVAMWNYMGWDDASLVADEVERPQRTYPLAMAARRFAGGVHLHRADRRGERHRPRPEPLDRGRLGGCGRRDVARRTRGAALAWRSRRRA